MYRAPLNIIGLNNWLSNRNKSSGSFRKYYEDKPEFPTVEVCFEKGIPYPFESCLFNGKNCSNSLNKLKYICQRLNSGSDGSYQTVEKQKSKSAGAFNGLVLKIKLDPSSVTHIAIYKHTYDQDKVICVSAGTTKDIKLKRIFE